MVFSIVVAVVIVGVFGAGPVLYSDARCSSDPSDASEPNLGSHASSKCEVEQIQATMRARNLPKELKVEIERELYSVPDKVEFVKPAFTGAKWWKRFMPNDRGMSEDDSDGGLTAKKKLSLRRGTTGDNGKHPGDEGAMPAAEKDVRSVGDHSCQICFEHDQSTAMLPCGHGGLCWDCGLQIYALTEECPMCRTKIELLVPLNSKKRRREGDDEYISAADFGRSGRPLVA